MPGPGLGARGATAPEADIVPTDLTPAEGTDTPVSHYNSDVASALGWGQHVQGLREHKGGASKPGLVGWKKLI